MSRKAYNDTYDNQGMEDIELGDSTSKKRETDSNSPDRSTDYFNYHPPFLLVISCFIIWIFLLLVCFTQPNNGFTAIFQDGEDYVGVLRKCSQTTCDAWISNSSSKSSSTSSSSESSNSNIKRAVTTSDLSNFYLTTGLACLASFWLITYILIFIIIRYLSSNLPIIKEKNQNKKNELSKFKKIWKSFKNPIKRISFKLSRIFLFFLSWLLLGISFDVTIKVFNVTGINGIRIGVFVLHICWILLFFIFFIEISRGSLRRKLDMTFWGLQFRFKHRNRALNKWKDYDTARKSRSNSSIGEKNQAKKQKRIERREEE
uniref:Uncharacterized protein n=1 Tax=Kwoniella pini CBS 10737 TaxID=1296096 RepID=A0A1B9IDQ0_9TREE|nr:uncharacterized protein I206_00856 [Kwoniella pini CBS 10737]OCF53551.1 hypothetical protein I206_00856 [Kwoniella pini CBS 10737]